jgi:hypothetical protein
MTPIDDSATGWRNFYGRRRGKTLKDHQRTWLAEDLQNLAPQGISVRDNPDRRQIDPSALFGDDRPLWLEVGFGGGEHMVHQAVQNPGVGLIGCEPFINGVAMLLGKIRRAGVTNLRVHPGDVRDLFDVLPDACLDRAFLLYPDPWPKQRHHRRRFVTPITCSRWPVCCALARCSGWQPIFPTTSARRWKKFPPRVSPEWRRRCTRLGTTGFRPATNRKLCERVGSRTT